MKARQIKRIEFWALRNSYGMNGVTLDNDVKVNYLCRVVRVKNGLKWQIIKNKHQCEDVLIDYDQECLDMTCQDDIYQM